MPHTSLLALLLSAAAVSSALAAPAPIAVNWVMYPGAPTATTSRRLVSFNLDWHPPHEGPTWGQNASVVTIDLQNKRLRALATALSPAYLRVGGSEGDDAVYDIPTGTCARAKADPAFCLSA